MTPQITPITATTPETVTSMRSGYEVRPILGASVDHRIRSSHPISTIKAARPFRRAMPGWIHRQGKGSSSDGGCRCRTRRSPTPHREQPHGRPREHHSGVVDCVELDVPARPRSGKRPESLGVVVVDGSVVGVTPAAHAAVSPATRRTASVLDGVPPTPVPTRIRAGYIPPSPLTCDDRHGDPLFFVRL